MVVEHADQPLYIVFASTCDVMCFSVITYVDFILILFDLWTNLFSLPVELNWMETVKTLKRYLKKRKKTVDLFWHLESDLNRCSIFNCIYIGPHKVFRCVSVCVCAHVCQMFGHWFCECNFRQSRTHSAIATLLGSVWICLIYRTFSAVTNLCHFFP